MEIRLVDRMGDDLSVVNAARVSFNKQKKKFDDMDVKLINYLAKHKHMTPFRHPHLSIRCTAPIFLARQLGKHQVGLSWNEVSRRYVDEPPSFFMPERWRSKPTNAKQGSGGDFKGNVIEASTMYKVDTGRTIEEYPAQTADDVYEGVLRHCRLAYTNMLDAGIAPEMARMVLPQSMNTTWIWTGSLLAFFHVWQLRIDSHAQEEAQIFAALMEQVIRPKFPYCWDALTRWEAQ